MVLVEACMPDQLVAIRDLESKIEKVSADMSAMEEENEEIFANENGDVMKASAIKAIIKAAKKDDSICSKEDLELYAAYIKISEAIDALKKKLKEETTKLTRDVQDKYAALKSEEIQQLVFTNKWMPAMRMRLEGLMQSAQQVVSADLHTLNDRYKNTLGQLTEKVLGLENTVIGHLKMMGL
jgi:type I restriction enzyme M protein